MIRLCKGETRANTLQDSSSSFQPCTAHAACATPNWSSDPPQEEIRASCAQPLGARTPLQVGNIKEPHMDKAGAILPISLAV